MSNPSSTPPDPPAFTPWRPARRRAGGWSPDVQREFIRQLARLGAVGAAARACGKSAQSAYALRGKDGAESFAVAWAEALIRGREEARDTAISRALHGEVVPQFRNGRFVRYRIRHNDKLLLGALWSGRRDLGRGRETALFAEWRDQLERWENALRREEMDRADGTAERAADAAQAWQDHLDWKAALAREKRRRRRAELRRLARKALTPKPAPIPRVRLL